MNIAPNGTWNCDTTEPHSFDEELAQGILKFIDSNKVESVVDFGCGSGAYVDYLNKHGISATGVDGNPNTEKFSPDCFVQDLSVPLIIVDKGYDCVLSLETGEHIPKEFEAVFLDNIESRAERFVILSWFPYKGEGIGHVNEQPNEYIQQQMLKRGFRFLAPETQALRDSSTLWWFKFSLMVFRRLKEGE